MLAHARPKADAKGRISASTILRVAILRVRNKGRMRDMTGFDSQGVRLTHRSST
jgi:hypothetical protein